MLCGLLVVSSLGLISLPKQADTVIFNQSSQLTIAAVTSGDLNGDGIEDIVLGGGQSIAIIQGRPVYPKEITLSSKTLPDTVIGDIDSTLVASQMTSVGDLNGDGIGDLLIATETGLSIYWGRKSWPKTIDWKKNPGNVQIMGKGKTGQHTLFHAATGDINKDGIDDLVLAYVYAPPPPPDMGFKPEDWTVSEQEIAGIFMGRASWPKVVDLKEQDPDVVLKAVQPGPVYRRLRQISIGDVDGDGYGDIVLGSWGDIRSVIEFPKSAEWAIPCAIKGGPDLPKVLTLMERPNSGVLGKPKLNLPIRCLKFSDGLIFSAGRPQIGDLTGDGRKDIVLKMFKRDGYKIFKELRIFQGNPDFFVSKGHHETIEFTSVRGGAGFTNENFIFSPDPMLGDLNGDGFEDLIVFSGYPEFSYKALWGRKTFPALLDIEEGATITVFPSDMVTQRAGHGFSHRLGKINGDTFADLMIVDALGGKSHEDPVGPGALYLVFGKKQYDHEKN